MDSNPKSAGRTTGPQAESASNVTEESDMADALADRQIDVAFTESVMNGSAINWRYWVQLPSLTAIEAALLLSGLDPDTFGNTDSPPDSKGLAALHTKATKIQRLAERNGVDGLSPIDWMSWAQQHKLYVHDGFKIALDEFAHNTSVRGHGIPAIVLAVGRVPGESHAERQARRYQMGVDAGLSMPKDDYSGMPRGIGAVAESEKITRQAFTEDVKAHIRRTFMTQ